MNRKIPLFSLIVLGAVSACSDSGGSSTIVGLTTPEQLSIVEPLAATPPMTPGLLLGADTFPSGAAYNLDETSVYVYDPALEPLETINRIMCAVDRTALDELVNQGPYLAQIDFEGCATGGEAGSGDPSDSDHAESFQFWVVESERASNAVPQAFRVWVPPDASTFMDTEILVEGTLVQAGPTRPAGSFQISFANVLPGESPASAIAFGGLVAVEAPSLSGYLHYESQGDVNASHFPGDRSSIVQVSVLTSPDGTTGNAHIREQTRRNDGGGDTGLQSDEYMVTFDETHFLRGTNGDGGVAFHRDQFRESVWNYGLYHATGPQAGGRVELNSGFGIRDPFGAYGWIGYYGLWSQDAEGFDHGTTVQREVFGELGEAALYSIVRAPGRLFRYERLELALTELNGLLFQLPEYDDMTGETLVFLIEYFPGTGTWEKTGVLDIESREVTPVMPTEVLDTSSLGFLGLWNESLGGEVSYVHGDAFVSFFEKRTIDGSDELFAGGGDLELFGFVQCLGSELSTLAAEAGDVYLDEPASLAAPYRFEFSGTDLALRHDVNGDGSLLADVGLADGATIDQGPFTWGLRTGPLLTSTAELGSIYDVWNADEFFVYETGPNEWNRFVGLRDALGDFVQFDAPLRIAYTHATANDRNADPTFDGQTFLLEYGGFGDLWGLPTEEVDLTGDGNPDRYHPILSLADGVELGTEGAYVVKALQVEQTLVEDTTYAGPLVLGATAALGLPDASIYTAPTNGPTPIITDPPRVIDGEVIN